MCHICAMHMPFVIWKTWFGQELKESILFSILSNKEKKKSSFGIVILPNQIHNINDAYIRV